MQRLSIFLGQTRSAESTSTDPGIAHGNVEGTSNQQYLAQAASTSAGSTQPAVALPTSATQFQQEAQRYQDLALDLSQLAGLSLQELAALRQRNQPRSVPRQLIANQAAGMSSHTPAMAPASVPRNLMMQPSRMPGNQLATTVAQQASLKEQTNQAACSSSHEPVRNPVATTDMTPPIPKSNDPEDIAAAVHTAINQLLETEKRPTKPSDLPLIGDDVNAPGWFYTIPTRYIRYHNARGHERTISRGDPYGIQDIMQSLPFAPPLYWTPTSGDNEPEISYMRALSNDETINPTTFPVYVSSFLNRTQEELRRNSTYREHCTSLIRDVHKLLCVCFPQLDHAGTPSQNENFILQDPSEFVLVKHIIAEAAGNCRDRFVLTLSLLRNTLFVQTLLNIRRKFNANSGNTYNIPAENAGMATKEELRLEAAMVLNLGFAFFKLGRLQEYSTSWLQANNRFTDEENMYAFYFACSVLQDELKLPFRIPPAAFNNQLQGFNEQLVREQFLPRLLEEINICPNTITPGPVLSWLGYWQPWQELLRKLFEEKVDLSWIHNKMENAGNQLAEGVITQQRYNSIMKTHQNDFEEQYKYLFAEQTLRALVLIRESLMLEGNVLPEYARRLLRHHFIPQG